MTCYADLPTESATEVLEDQDHQWKVSLSGCSVVTCCSDLPTESATEVLEDQVQLYKMSLSDSNVLGTEVLTKLGDEYISASSKSWKPLFWGFFALVYHNAVSVTHECSGHYVTGHDMR